MLTRLEVNGFKNLLKFAVDFGPFNCIAGPNGAGKSNIFDAIRFLSLLADHTILEAALQVRDTDPLRYEVKIGKPPRLGRLGCCSMKRRSDR